MTPYFSVIVPVYNVEPYLAQCVDSILSQTFSGFELFLVDDGSPDGSGALCDAYAARDSRVTAIHQPNRGVTAARQAALDRARGQVVCFVDGDDWVMENWLETIHALFLGNPGADMIAFRMTMSDDHPDPPLTAPEGYYDKARMEKEIYPYMIWDRREPFLIQLIPGFLWSKAYRRELLLAHFIQDRSITLYEDTAMVYECLYNAQGLYVYQQPLYVYRYREGSAVLSYAPKDIQNMRVCRDYLVDHLIRQAPELAPQVDAFFMDKLMRAMTLIERHTDSLWQAARRIGADLDETGLARAISSRELPGRMRLFLALLQHRAYLPAVLVHRGRVWLYHHRPAALFRRLTSRADAAED